jgi:hypothetical protein
LELGHLWAQRQHRRRRLWIRLCDRCHAGCVGEGVGE